jgi:hypothetical protein
MSQIVGYIALIIVVIGLSCNFAYIMSNSKTFIGDKAIAFYRTVAVISFFATMIVIVIALGAIHEQPTHTKMYRAGYDKGYKTAMDAKIQHILKNK